MEKLIAAKNVQVTIDGNEGIAQSISVNVAQMVERLMAIGSSASVPFAGYYSAQVNIRYFVTNSPLSVGNLVQNITITIQEGDKKKTITAKEAYVNSKSISVQAGQILVYEDLTFECRDVQIS